MHIKLDTAVQIDGDNKKAADQGANLTRFSQLEPKESTIINVAAANYSLQDRLLSAKQTASSSGLLARLHPKQCCAYLARRLSKHVASDGDADAAERQARNNNNKQSNQNNNNKNNNKKSVGTLQLFRYASRGERLAVAMGMLCMLYAASWQPISVFILASMAGLMGQYSRQVSWLEQFSSSLANVSLDTAVGASVSAAAYSAAAAVAAAAGPKPTTATTTNSTPAASPFSLLEPIDKNNNNSEYQSTLVKLSVELSSQEANSLPGFLRPIFSLLEPYLFDRRARDETMQSAIADLSKLASRNFLRESFEINGSAFILAQTQLLAFFVGMSLIVWSAKRQASRLKILYFGSCLRQELTWFESLNDEAAGSGSSLNVLVGKYEDGIGVKLALLSYFVGHIILFALTAFYQLLSLAAFCMPFVLIVALIICHLSQLQSVAIGEHSLFAKRSLKLAEEIMLNIKTVFAFNGQPKELVRFNLSSEPVYRKSLLKHLYTALNVAISKFSIFACFAVYCFYARRLFPPYTPDGPSAPKAVVLAVMRGAEVSIVNIVISIPFMEALQQSKGCIACIYQIIERKSLIDPTALHATTPATLGAASGCVARRTTKYGSPKLAISFRRVCFHYAQRPRMATVDGLPASQTSVIRRPTLSHIKGSLIDRRASELAFKQLELAYRRESAVPEADLEEEEDGKDTEFEFESGDSRKASISAARLGSIAGAAPAPATCQVQAAPRKLSASECILNNFNLDIEPGQSVALVGPSGSGKSTVLSLVQRLYDISQGQLLIDGREIGHLPVGYLRDQIGVVSQEPRLFDLTIAENIKLGLSREQLRLFAGQPATIEQQVIQAAKLASAHKFICRLPLAYKTRVGSGGLQLSGGQKQRIAIARALIRRPKLLLLDECTSALDSESEAHVQAALCAASSNRTTLIVAHRLASVKHVDKIVMMAAGRVLETGTHAELMAAGGAYKAMYERQAAHNNNSNNNNNGANPAASDAEPADWAGPDANPNSNLNSDPNQAKQPAAPRATKAGRSGSGGSATTSKRDSSDSSDAGKSADSSDSQRRAQPSAWFSLASGLRLIRFVELPKWSALAASLACLLAGLILPINLIAHSYLFRAFAYDSPQQLGADIHLFGLLMLSFSAIVFIVTFLQITLPGYVGEKMSLKLRAKLMEALLSKPIFYFDVHTNGAGALCDRFNTHISNIQQMAGIRVATLLEASSTLIVSAIFGLGQNLSLSLFCLAFAILVLFTTIIESRLMELESNQERLHDSKLANLMADALTNMKTIASLNVESYFANKYTEIIERRQRSLPISVTLLRTFLTSLKFVMPAMSWSASMYYGCLLLVEGRIDMQTVFIVCPVVLFALNDTFRALVFLPELLKARKSVKHLYRMYKEFSPGLLKELSLADQLKQQSLLVENTTDPDPVTATSKTTTTTLTGANQQQQQQQQPPALISGQNLNRRLSRVDELPSYLERRRSCLNSLVPQWSTRGQISFEQVEFAYPNRAHQLVLDQFTLTIEPGECVALVGGSGSGKSTCVALLEKFYDFHGGKIALDGNDLRLVEANWVRSQIGLVTQEPSLLSYTIAENIRYGDNSRLISMQEVVEAAKTANIHDFIMSLPDQYETQLAGGVAQLSGGQRQRIAIARALIKKAPILVFDEATSALDSHNESLVQSALNKVRRGKTTLIIAHRLSTIRQADKIVVMQEGRVVEMGKHHELLQLPSGHYRALWQRQDTAAQMV